MKNTLESYFATERVIKDLTKILKQHNGQIELEGEIIHISQKPKLEIVAKSFHSYSVEIGFGDHYRALVAIGGIESIEHGIVSAVCCFATLWYSCNLELITIDFSIRMP